MPTAAEPPEVVALPSPRACASVFALLRSVSPPGAVRCSPFGSVARELEFEMLMPIAAATLMGPAEVWALGVAVVPDPLPGPATVSAWPRSAGGTAVGLWGPGRGSGSVGEVRGWFAMVSANAMPIAAEPDEFAEPFAVVVADAPSSAFASTLPAIVSGRPAPAVRGGADVEAAVAH